MSIAIHGALETFNPTEKDWSEYSERLTFYFTTYGITTDAKKRAVSYRLVTFRLLQGLVLLGKLKKFSFEQLMTKMKEHKEPQPSVIIC